MEKGSKTLVVNNVSKHFGGTKAVDAVDLEIGEGQIFALVGPNGSGKTSLIKLIVGLSEADGGSISVFGYKQPEESGLISPQLGYLPDDPEGFEELTGREFLWFVSRLRGLENATAGPRIEELLGLFPLSDQPDQLISQYSRGTKQKIAFLAGILAWPRLVVIDEPIVGLDPGSIDIFKDKLKSLAKEGTAVLFATHILGFATDLADRVGFMVNGKIVKQVNNKKGMKLKAVYKEIVG